MLPENEEIKKGTSTSPCYHKFDLPELSEPRNIRIKFRKVGSLQYISHLDLQRTFMRVFTRSGIPLWYTQGFNPHPKLVFATPLSVGTQSVCEYLDIRINREISCGEIRERLDFGLTDELKATEVYLPETKFSDIAFAEYQMIIHAECANEDMAEKLDKLYTVSPLNVVKKTKSGDKEFDLVPLIKSIDISFDRRNGNIVMNTVLPIGGEDNLNPELLISAARKSLGLLAGEGKLDREWYTVMKKRILLSDAKTDFR